LREIRKISSLEAKASFVAHRQAHETREARETRETRETREREKERERERERETAGGAPEASAVTC
jgi:hypothetical protein